MHQTSPWYSTPLRVQSAGGPADQTRYRTGRELLQQGLPVEAARILSEDAEAWPDQPRIWADLGMAMVGIDQSVRARACFERSLALSPNQPDVLANLGTILLHAGLAEPALGAFRKALALRPGLIPAQRNACLALYALGRDREAEALLPHSEDRLVLRGQALREQGALAAATDCYRDAIRLLEQAGIPAAAAQGTAFTRTGARQALLDAKERLDSHGLSFCLLAGTLLGVVREGDLLAHDKDLDLGMEWDTDRDQVVATLCAGGLFSVSWIWGILPTERPYYRSFTHTGTGCTLDVFFLCREGDAILCGFDNRPVPVLSRLRAFGLQDWTWVERTWKVPAPPENYLVQIYGSGWSVPDKSYDTILSNPCRTPESLPGVLCMGYLRLYEALKEAKLGRARALLAQIHARQPDDFLVGLGARLDLLHAARPRAGTDA